MSRRRERNSLYASCLLTTLRSASSSLSRRTTEGQALARRLGVGFVETSAKTCVNVEKAYYTVVRQIREQRGETTKGKGAKSQGGGQKKKSKCTIL